MDYEEEDQDQDQDQEEHEHLQLNPNLHYTNDNSPTPRLTPVKIPMDTAGGDLSPVLPRNKPKYRECLKNHAVAIGGHATDGCGEFLASGPEGTLESLKCASCNCHRNFHRKENNNNDTPFGAAFHSHHHQQHPQLLLTHHPHGHFGYRSPSGYLHVTQQQRGAGMPLALPSSSGGGGGGSRDEMDQDYYSNPSSSGGKKRFRTRFTQEQKDKMLSLAERLGWRIQKQDEEIIQEFCSEVGVKRHVLKVWMHNNKHTLGKKS